MKSHSAILILVAALALVCVELSLAAESKSDIKTPCGPMVASGEGGELISHSTFTECAYSADLACSWKIEGDKEDSRSRLAFSFEYYEMPRKVQPCSGSYLRFHDGEDASKEAFKSFCDGRSVPEAFNSTGNQVYVDFKANSFGAKGFVLKWYRFRFCDVTVGDFICGDGSCIDGAQRCDGAKNRKGLDCADGSDEESCPEVKCSPKQFRCAHKLRCVDKKLQLCNGVADCTDNSDESKEAGCTPVTCNATQFRCDHKFACISSTTLCDGKKDCSDGSDETPKLCDRSSLTCSAKQFKCSRVAKCVDMALRCNTANDCGGGSDEEGCAYKHGGPPCALGYYFCRETKKCIEDNLVCNGVNDCGGKDTADEDICPRDMCESKWHKCKNTQYVLDATKCAK